MTEEELRLLRKDAEGGAVIAQYMLGKAYLWADGVKQDHKEAIVWLTKAREQGSEDAQKLLNIHARAHQTYMLGGNPNKTFSFRDDGE